MFKQILFVRSIQTNSFFSVRGNLKKIDLVSFQERRKQKKEGKKERAKAITKSTFTHGNNERRKLAAWKKSKTAF